MRTLTLKLFSIAGSAFMLAAVGAAPAVAATVATQVPCSGPGGGANGLIAAINAANAGGGGTLALAQGCTYTLTKRNNVPDPSHPDNGNGLPIVTKPITVRGNGATIARSTAASTPLFRIFDVASTGNLTLNDVTVTGGKTDDDAGGILNNGGTAKLVNTVVTGNTSLTGGGVFNDHGGTLNVVTSSLTHNSATYTGLLGGGAILAGDHSVLTVLGSEVSNNTAGGVGGGIQIFESARADIRSSGVDDNSSDGNDGGIAVGDVGFTPGFLTMVNSHVRRNHADDNGGIGIYLAGTTTQSTATIKSSDISDNVVAVTDPNDQSQVAVGAGIMNGGVLDLIGSTVRRNVATGGTARGAGIYNERQSIAATPGPVLRIRDNSVVSDNVANGIKAFGGGIANDNNGTVTLVNSRVARNSATASGGATGGGIYNQHTVNLTNTPVINNQPNNCAPPGSVPGCAG